MPGGDGSRDLYDIGYIILSDLRIEFRAKYDTAC